MLHSLQAYKHIFTSPSSVDRIPKATRSGNARIHGMTCVTPASIAYVATQVRPSFAVSPRSLSWFYQARFALSSAAVFSRSDTITDSERFYTSILELFDDIDEQQELQELVIWWNRYCLSPRYSQTPMTNQQFLWCGRQIFPSYSSAKRPVAKDSALARIKEQRALKKAAVLDVADAN